MKFIFSAHKLKLQISLLQRTSIADSQSQATKLAQIKFFIYLHKSGDRKSTAGFLFVILYFNIFIHQWLGADIAMNSLPAAMPNRFT
jgi:hypothetical protein